ncbi:putative oxidoreductase C2F3.05c [Golovinomyces cichoracearum]|uniref:Putative oxidoreductase C2F3.05c n=1 Tax=Golovinomyces cichoracearum TaxID=62708 RepID=A0A420I093_9PEZI|nr:putative oxidoreductase C2F3.05c [Golovinomyces cichoracearum]
MVSQNLSIKDGFNLPNSIHKIPKIGFGVYKSPPSQCTQSCLAALKCGYRHIDTAQYYANEHEVGEAIRLSKLKRSDVFITTKIIKSEGSVHATYLKLLESVAKIDGEDGYVDLFLIHTADGGSRGRKEMYMALEKLLQIGKTKSIGVSNWGIGHIEELEPIAKVYPPHVNQIELHPFCQQREIVSFCHKNNIVVEAYCPIVRGLKNEHPTLVKIAEAHGKIVTQVLLRYSVQKNWVPLPKSDQPLRIAQNIDIFDFELTEEEMKEMDALDEGSKGAIVVAVTNELQN